MPPKKKVKAAADANTFLGQNTMKEDSSSKGKNKVSPMINGSAKTSNGAISNGKAHNSNPLGTKGNKLPSLKNDKFQRIRDAVQKMKDQGIIKPKKKMDLAALVMVLSSKGDWSAPEWHLLKVYSLVGVPVPMKMSRMLEIFEYYRVGPDLRPNETNSRWSVSECVN